MTGANGEGRIERIEKALERLIDEHRSLIAEHRRLLTAQVVLTDTVQRLAETQAASDERLNALIGVVDGIVRRPAKGESQ